MAKKKKKSGLSSLYEDELGFGQTPETRTEAYIKLLEPYWKNNPVAKLGFELVGGAKGIVKLIESSDPEKRKLYNKTFRLGSTPGLSVVGLASRLGRYPRKKEGERSKSALKVFKEYGATKLFPEALKRMRQEKPWVMYKTKGMGSPKIRSPILDIDEVVEETGKEPTISQRQDYNEGLATLVHELTHIGDMYLAQSNVDPETIPGVIQRIRGSKMKGHSLINELDYIMQKRLSNTPYSGINRYQQGNPLYEYDKLDSLATRIYGYDEDKWPQKIKDMLKEEKVKGKTILENRSDIWASRSLGKKLPFLFPTLPKKETDIEKLIDEPQIKRVLNDPIFRDAQYELEKLKKLYKQLGSEE